MDNPALPVVERIGFDGFYRQHFARVLNHPEGSQSELLWADKLHDAVWAMLEAGEGLDGLRSVDEWHAYILQAGWELPKAEPEPEADTPVDPDWLRGSTFKSAFDERMQEVVGGFNPIKYLGEPTTDDDADGFDRSGFAFEFKKKAIPEPVDPDAYRKSWLKTVVGQNRYSERLYTALSSHWEAFLGSVQEERAKSEIQIRFDFDRSTTTLDVVSLAKTLTDKAIGRCIEKFRERLSKRWPVLEVSGLNQARN